MAKSSPSLQSGLNQPFSLMKSHFFLTILFSAFNLASDTPGQTPQPNNTVVAPQPVASAVDGFIVVNGTIYFVSQGNATVLPDSLRLSGTLQGINGFPQLIASLQPGSLLTLDGNKVAAPTNITFGANADGSPLAGVKAQGTNADGSPMGGSKPNGTNADGSRMGGTRPQGTNADGSPMGGSKPNGTNADGSRMGGSKPNGTNADGSPMGGFKPQPPQAPRQQPVAPPVAPAKKP